ncbi:MAG: siderophore-interacting protein [Pseudomonadota bacterium]
MRKKSEPRIFDVLSVRQITPNMRRVSIGGPALETFPTGQDGGYLKLVLSEDGSLQRPMLRTYTIARQGPDALDVDFALHGEHGDGGPASSWAQKVKPGEKIQARGPGPQKPLPPGFDWYLVFGDMTALPAIAVNLANLPEDAVGNAVIEVQTEDDRQNLPHPKGIKIDWVINPEPGRHPKSFERVARSITWRPGRVYAWSATEFDVMKNMRRYLREERGLTSGELYISSYWKQGIGEDKHREIKSADAKQASKPIIGSIMEKLSPG